MSIEQQLVNNYRYHPPKDNEQIKKYQMIRTHALQYAELLNNLCPESREKSLAMTKLEEAIMWANASVARSE